MTDLEYAAKVAGIETVPEWYSDKLGCAIAHTGTHPTHCAKFWNPRESNEDSFALMCSIGISLLYLFSNLHGSQGRGVRASYLDVHAEIWARDIQAATRETIFQVAVQIGKEMK